MIEVPNWDVFIPYITDKNLLIDKATSIGVRGEQRGFILLNAETQATLPFVPTNKFWVQIFDETGFAVINPNNEVYSIVNDQIIFTQPTTGRFLAVCDTKPYHDPQSTVIHIKNVQGFLSAKASLYVEPIIMTEPTFGYARISEDRMSIVYRQTNLTATQDSFSYCLINNHGQYSNNACIYITFKG